MERDPRFEIAGRVIFVAGAAGGLGSAIAKALAARGATLILTDRQHADVARLAANCAGAGGVETGALDVLDEAAVERAIRDAADRHGRLDGLVNAAGIYRVAPFTELTSDDFRLSVDCNITGPFFLTRAAARAMGMGGTGGRILHLASVSSRVSNPRYAAYASSKAGLSHMIRVAARELAPQDITVNAIGQAMTETPLSAGLLADPDERARVISQIPMGRLCTAEDILATVIMLLAPGGRFVTGQTLYVDGGRTLV